MALTWTMFKRQPTKRAAVDPSFESRIVAGRVRAYAGLTLVMSPYKFMSKTHSLSTEDLGKFFID